MYNSIYPNYANAYYGINNRQITRKKEEEKSSQSSNAAAENNPDQEREHSSNNYTNTHFPNGEKVAIDYTKRKIGIDQVLSDFRNTANAIGAPENIRGEVDSYLQLIENQAQKESPNPQIIQSNLKNASQILDEYITKTLKKPSKVVENWVDALFLQQIDYKSQVITGAASQIEEEQAVTETPVEEIVEEETVVAEIVEETPEEQEQPVQVNNGVYVPSDPQLKRMFIQAKKYAAIDNKEQALYSFQNTMAYAEDIGDVQTCAMINYEEGKIYDDFNQVEDALYCYHQATQQSSDNNLKARAHLSMGKIYDDYVNFAPAVDHFCSAVSFAGEADNQILQTQALSDLAQVHTDKYDKENAIKFMDMSTIVANETNNSKVKGITYSKNAKMSEKLGEKVRALNMYSNSAQSFHSIDDNENLAKNYRSAAEIMLQYGNTAKAKRLLSKAYIAAQQTGNLELKQQISKDLAAV